MADWANSRILAWSLSVAGSPNAAKIHTFTSPAELRALYDLAAGCPPNATVLEVGSYVGASTCFIGAGLSHGGGGVIYCLDTWQNETMPGGIRDTLAEFCANTTAYASAIKIVQKRSDEVTPADLPGPVDLAFVDADHSYDAVKADFAIVARILAPRGVVALHDVAAYQGVSRVTGEALATGAWCIGGAVENLIWLHRKDWQQ